MILTMLLLVSTDMEVFSCACMAFAVSLLLAFCVLMSAVLLQVGQCARASVCDAASACERAHLPHSIAPVLAG